MEDVRVCPDAHALARAAAAFIAEESAVVIASRGRFSMALSGGSTPRGTYAALASGDPARRVRWDRVHVFWGDERCVPKDHPQSNFSMASETLLSIVPIPKGNVHPMRTDLPPEEAAAGYADELKRILHVTGDGLPRFDLVLLGIGVDGHTASLFPDEDLAGHAGRVVVATKGVKHGHRRLTITLPVINNAACVTFLVSGEEKAPVLSRVLGGRPPQPPAGLVRPRDGRLVWFAERLAIQP